jgi:hypothetical protein
MRYNFRMRLLLSLIFLFLLVFSASAQTEVVYPSIPGSISPQEISTIVDSQEEIFPLFMAYLFHLVLIVSVLVTLGVVVYGGLLYLLSSEDPEKKKNAKSWILSAFHGAFIIFSSFLLLSVLDSRLVVFKIQDLQKRDPIEKISLEWTIKNVYFQIPFGLLVEDTAININARDKFYDILDAIYDAEDTADAIIWGGQDLLDIMDVCPIGDACCDDFPFCDWPPIPFEMLKRAKEPRPNLTCWWDNRAKRSGGSQKMGRPPIEPLPLNTIHNYLDIVTVKRRIRSVTNELKNTVSSFFPSRMETESSMWKLKESLTEIINKLESVLSYQQASFDVTLEFRKITKELDILVEEYPLLKEEPFKSVIYKMSGDWILGYEVLAKGDSGYKDVLYVEQDDLKWRHIRYNYDTLYSSGCLLASTVMAFEYFGIETDIIEALNFANAHGHGSILGGTFFTFPCHFAQTKGLRCRRVSNPGPGHFSEMVNWLENNGPIVVGGVHHPWSMGGRHAVTLTGVDRSKKIIYISDPSRAFLHSVTFGEVLSNMPFEIAYISKSSSFLDYSEKETSFSPEIKKVLSNGGSDGCPEISCAIQIKINEIQLYMFKHERDLWVIFFAKDLKKEGLYQLYKALMLKSLGVEHVLNYPSLLLEKSYYDEKSEVVIETDDDFTKIHRFNTSGQNPYIWDWEKWINNILYKTEIDCTATVANDPVTFYLRKPDANDIIKDALVKLAYRRKQGDIQYLSIRKILKNNEETLSDKVSNLVEEIFNISYVDTLLSSEDMKNEITSLNFSPKIIWYYQRFLKNPSSEINVFASNQSPSAMLQKYFEENKIDPKSVSEEELKKILETLNINPEDVSVFDIRSVGFSHASDYLTCGMEIPIGETFQLIWDHFIELLFVMDGYIVEGLELLELQKIMNIMAAQCACPCCGPCCSDECASCCGGCSCEYDCPPGMCVLTCDKEMIESFYLEEIIPQREKMSAIALYLKHLTAGFFQDSTENICHFLNEEIRDESEKLLCNRGGSRFITKHELITRKLNYSRHAFDECATPSAYLDDVLEGRRAGKVPVFGPIAEKEDLPRYTKTRKGEAYINTHDYNWFCCTDNRISE